ncbi:MAG: Sip1-related alpha-galactosidase [Candidatus Sumerlaeia bacterium]
MAIFKIDGTSGQTRVETINLSDAQPDEGGALWKADLALPEFDRLLYWAPSQKYDVINIGDEKWPDGANRMQALLHDDLTSLKLGGVLMLLRLTSGDYLAILPIAGPRTLAWFESDGTAGHIACGNLGTGSVDGEIPLAAWSIQPDPYAALRNVWQAARHHPLVEGRLRLRDEKAYPEIFNWLGWCSWEEYRVDISESVILDAIAKLKASPLPVRWALVDDGYLDMTPNRQLKSFGTDKQKFPNGWKPVTSQKDGKLRWMGLWRNFNGHFQGASPDHTMDHLRDLMQVVECPVLVQNPDKPDDARLVLPKNDRHAAMEFYRTMMRDNCEGGFDFVKVDNQARNLRFYKGTEQAVEASANCSQALEMNAAYYQNGLINCMAHNALCTFNTTLSAVTRCSEDYAKNSLPKARRHLYNSYVNMLWLGQIFWGDHDMFHSSDTVCGRMMAVSKALSGGPVYLSDAPDGLVEEFVRPLCDADGRIYRPLAPATVTADSIFIDPYSEAAAVKAVAPLTNHAAAIAVYNLTEPEKPVGASISQADYIQAAVLMQRDQAEWDCEYEGLLLYDWYEETTQELDSPCELELAGFGDRYFLICPIIQGVALIGRTDKYLSPATVEVVDRQADRLLVRSAEDCSVTCWTSKKGLFTHEVKAGACSEISLDA